MARPPGLRIQGARQNNLKNVSLEIPHDRLTVVTGVSKASDDVPEPDTPVTTVSRSCGISSETFLRLFCRAPWIRSPEGWAIRTVLLRWVVYWKGTRRARAPRG